MSSLSFLYYSGRIISVLLSAMMLYRAYGIVFHPQEGIQGLKDLAASHPILPVEFISFKDEEGHYQADRFAHASLLPNLHFFFGVIFAIAVPLQFTPRIRENLPAFHRLTGYSTMISSWIMTLAAVGMTTPFANVAYGGFSFDMVNFALALVMLVTSVKALTAARAGQYLTHSEWIVRHVFAAYTIALFRVLGMPLAFYARHYRRFLPDSLCAVEEIRGFVGGGAWVMLFITSYAAEIYINLSRSAAGTASRPHTD